MYIPKRGAPIHILSPHTANFLVFFPVFLLALGGAVLRSVAPATLLPCYDGFVELQYSLIYWSALSLPVVSVAAELRALVQGLLLAPRRE